MHACLMYVRVYINACMPHVCPCVYSCIHASCMSVCISMHACLMYVRVYIHAYMPHVCPCVYSCMHASCMSVCIFMHACLMYVRDLNAKLLHHCISGFRNHKFRYHKFLGLKITVTYLAYSGFQRRRKSNLWEMKNKYYNLYISIIIYPHYIVMLQCLSFKITFDKKVKEWNVYTCLCDRMNINSFKQREHFLMICMFKKYYELL